MMFSRTRRKYSTTAKCYINDRIIDNNVSQFPFLGNSVGACYTTTHNYRDEKFAKRSFHFIQNGDDDSFMWCAIESYVEANKY